MDNTNKFEHVGLPPKGYFYSKLKLEGISDEGYEHATNVYNNLIAKNS